MGRPALDPAYKVARYEAARAEARRLNRSKLLPRRVYAFAMPSGKVYVRFEPVGGRKVTLKAAPGTPEFLTELSARMRGEMPLLRSPAIRRPEPASKPETWRALCQAFFRSNAFMKYPAVSRRVRRNVLERTFDEPLLPTEPNGKKFGDCPVPKFQYQAVATLKERFARVRCVPDEMFPDARSKDRFIPTAPEAGNSVVRYIRLVFEWAKEHHNDLVRGRNWGREVRLYGASKSGWKVWTPTECQAYEARHQPGSKARLVYDIAKLTGQRRSDVARLGRGMITRDGKGRERLEFVQAKNRNADPVIAYVPIVPDLEAALAAAKDAGVLGEATFIQSETGRAYTGESLGNYFNRCCGEAGLRGYSMHGLRKTSVISLVEAGCSWHEIMAISGHRSRKEIERYARDFSRGTASSSALDRVLRGRDLMDEGERLRQAA